MKNALAHHEGIFPSFPRFAQTFVTAWISRGFFVFAAGFATGYLSA
jgi:hypothetical protein